MTDAAIIRATFSEWRMVKGRKVLQLVCEVPLEAQEHVLRTLGAPMPDQETWVAIARLNTDAAQQPAIEDKRPTFAQVAGILCNEGAFNAWGREHGYDDGKAYIYDRCAIRSRRELDTDHAAAQRFVDMRAEYLAWMQVAT